MWYVNSINNLEALCGYHPTLYPDGYADHYYPCYIEYFSPTQGIRGTYCFANITPEKVEDLRVKELFVEKNEIEKRLKEIDSELKNVWGML